MSGGGGCCVRLASPRPELHSASRLVTLAAWKLAQAIKYDVVFVHGHLGSFKQMRCLASETGRESLRRWEAARLASDSAAAPVFLQWWAPDFRSEATALDQDLLVCRFEQCTSLRRGWTAIIVWKGTAAWQPTAFPNHNIPLQVPQARFLRSCLRFLAKRRKGRQMASPAPQGPGDVSPSLILVGYSLGSLTAQTALGLQGGDGAARAIIGFLRLADPGPSLYPHMLPSRAETRHLLQRGARALERLAVASVSAGAGDGLIPATLDHGPGGPWAAVRASMEHIPGVWTPGNHKVGGLVVGAGAVHGWLFHDCCWHVRTTMVKRTAHITPPILKYFTRFTIASSSHTAVYCVLQPAGPGPQPSVPRSCGMQGP